MKKNLLIIAIVAMASLFLAAGIYAGTAFVDNIKMENKIYSAHTKGIVDFSHKKHTEDYKAACGECHHDASNKPLALKAGDNVQGCAECHPKPGLAPKGKDAPQLSAAEKMQYHAEALHGNCIDCHKKYNTEKGVKNAPTACTKCHPSAK